MQMKEIQKKVLENKKRHGFNITDMAEEFCYLYREVGEAWEAYYKCFDTFPEELADIAIFLLGIAEINKIDLKIEICKKMAKNENRKYIRNKLGYMVQDTNEVCKGDNYANEKSFEKYINMTMRQIQKEIHENEIKHNFNITKFEKKFCNLYGEIGEAWEAYYKESDTFSEELANIAIYLLGIAEIREIDLEVEILRKMEINKWRKSACNELGYVVHVDD